MRFKIAMTMAALFLVAGLAAALPGWVPGGYVPNPVDTGTDYETIKVMFVMDKTLVTGHALAAYDADYAAADTVIELGTDVDFAFDEINKNYINDINPDLHKWRGSRSVDFDMQENASARILTLLYVDFASVLPAGCTVLDSRLHGLATDSWFMGQNDSTFAVLLTGENDVAWYSDASLGFDYDGHLFPNYAHASWNAQVQGTDSVRVGFDAPQDSRYGYPATTTDLWNPPLDDRIYYWDWGDFFDWSSYPDAGGSWAAPVPAVGEEFQGNMTNCVQAIQNGETNNGILSTQYDSFDTGAHRMRQWQVYNTTDEDEVPWITVEYSTAPYVSPYPGGTDWALTFSSDDGVVDANDDWSDIFEAHGGSYTIFIEEQYMGDNNRATWPDAINWREKFMEIANHGRWGGIPAYGFRGYCAQPMTIVEYTTGVDISTFTGAATGWDSLLADSDPEWIFVGLEGEDSTVDWRNDRLIGQSLGFPNGRPNPECIMAIDYHGYKIARQLPGASTANDDDYYEFRAIAADTTQWCDETAAVADTMKLHGSQQWPLAPRQMLIVPTTTDIFNIFGYEVDGPGTEAGWKFNIRRRVHQARAQGSRILSLATHDFRTGGGYAGTGVDSIQMVYLLEIVDETNGWPTNITAWSDHVKYMSDLIGTPAAYDQDVGYRFTISDRAWFKPKANSAIWTPSE